MKKYLPLIIGLIALPVLYLLPIRSNLFIIVTIIYAIPQITYILREKEAGDLPYQGCLAGVIVGCFVGAIIMNWVMNLIYKDVVKYSIRLDLLLGALLGASILSSLGIIAGGWIGKHRKGKSR